MACNYTYIDTVPCVVKDDTFIGREYVVTDEVTGIPIDLTGAVIDLLLDDNSIKLSTTDGRGLTITDGINGVFEIDKQIIIFTHYNYSFKIRFTLADGSVKTYIAGTWEIEK